MNRRNFLGTLLGAAAASVAVRTFPFRAYSIPTRIDRLYWFGTDHAFLDGNVWILSPEQAKSFKRAFRIADVQALELEAFADEIPDLFSEKHAMYKSFYRDSISGIDYIESDVVGTINGIERSKYPGRLAPNQRTIARGAFTVTDVDDDEKTITVAPSYPEQLTPKVKNALVKQADAALGDIFKEQDLVFRGIRDRVRDFVATVKRA